MGLFLTPPTKKTFRAAWIIAILGLLGTLFSPWAGVVGLSMAWALLTVGVTKKGW